MARMARMEKDQRHCAKENGADEETEGVIGWSVPVSASGCCQCTG